MALKMLNQTEKDIFFMREALQLAQTAALQQEVPVGAIVVADDQIVGSGHNRPIAMRDPSAHAEMLALRQAAQQLNNYRLPQVTLYVTLEPCLMCLGAMLHARIQRLVFGAPDAKTGAVISLFQVLHEPQLNHKITYTSGILADECGTILSEFFKARRKKRDAIML